MHYTVLHVYQVDTTTIPLRSADALGLEIADSISIGKHGDNRCSDIVGNKIIVLK